ncbi:hypothetical protein E5Q_03243 [Mixia osmundae IAM 14324]|uniref:Uncharacterized protein n=1 Tax=Mixia osmundae (strain CBS 9802 / IAM 14324 / JCM 22182 / KY 12970) TaxID=764103 RepID=G7E164_MIXOS|nr:hypothetical protein E5Q_03243 [Mixia osmundae IAM 14324]
MVFCLLLLVATVCASTRANLRARHYDLQSYELVMCAQAYSIVIVMRERDDLPGTYLWIRHDQLSGRVVFEDGSERGVIAELTLTPDDYTDHRLCQPHKQAPTDARCNPAAIGHPKEVTWCTPGFEWAVKAATPYEEDKYTYTVLITARCQASRDVTMSRVFVQAPAVGEPPLVLSFDLDEPDEVGRRSVHPATESVTGRFQLDVVDRDAEGTRFALYELETNIMPETIHCGEWRKCCSARSSIKFYIRSDDGNLTVQESSTQLHCENGPWTPQYRSCSVATARLLQPKPLTECVAHSEPMRPYQASSPDEARMPSSSNPSELVSASTRRQRVQLSEETTPTKRHRSMLSTGTLSPSDTVIEDEVNVQESRPIASVPVAIQLIHTATCHLKAAQRLAPLLARRPEFIEPFVRESKQRPGRSTRAYAELVMRHRRFVHAAVVYLRHCIALASDRRTVSIELELVARALLADTLLTETQDTSEASEITTKGLTLAQRSPDYLEFRCRFYDLQYRIAIAQNQHRFAETTLQRAITMLKRSDKPPPHYLYHFMFRKSNNSNSLALRNLREIETLARSRDDTGVVSAAQLQMATLAARLLDAKLLDSTLVQLLGPEGQEVDSDSQGMIDIAASMLRALHQTRTHADIKPAKSTLKRVHAMLDATEATENETKIEILASLNVTLPPYSAIYAYAFLVSMAVHRDPIGKTPRSLLYAEEGLSCADARLEGSPDSLPSSCSSVDIIAGFEEAAKLKRDVLTLSFETHLARGDLAKATSILTELIDHCERFHRLPESYQRLALLLGMLDHARGDLTHALPVMQVASTGNSPEAHTAKLSLQLLETGASMISVHDSTPGMRAASLIVQAVKCRQLVQTKRYLSSALQISNDASMNYLKPLILALLANLFAHTRSDQANKMVSMSQSLAVGLAANKTAEHPTHNVKLFDWLAAQQSKLATTTNTEN